MRQFDVDFQCNENASQVQFVIVALDGKRVQAQEVLDMISDALLLHFPDLTSSLEREIDA